MSFSATPTKRQVFGQQRVVIGTFTQVSGDTGGVVNTGLASIDYFNASCDVISVTLNGGAVTVVTKDPVANQNGYWEARGR